MTFAWIIGILMALSTALVADQRLLMDEVGQMLLFAVLL
jgi:hypothetical protein